MYTHTHTQAIGQGEAATKVSWEGPVEAVDTNDFEPKPLRSKADLTPIVKPKLKPYNKAL